MSFDMLSAEEIVSARATDAYFNRTVTTLEYAEKNPNVVMEVTADQFPTGDFEVFAGVKDAAYLLADLPVTVSALEEGTLFDGGPVMQIEGRYRDFCRVETPLLGFVSHASGIATNSLHARRAAPNSILLSFGSRHVHPAIAPIVERSALIGGFDGFSHVAAGDVINRDAGGTMPHSLIICFGKGNQESAWQAFDAAVDDDTPRIALCDTFTDETDESLRAAYALDGALESVRLDTTGSRRGDFAHIVREVRWELDMNGFDDVGIFVSGGLDLETLRELRDIVKGFGVGGYVSNASPVDFALDIVEVDGESIAKRGKLAGAKEVYRTPSGGHQIKRREEPVDRGAESLLKPLIEDGEIVREFVLDDAIARCAADAKAVLGENNGAEDI